MADANPIATRQRGAAGLSSYALREIGARASVPVAARRAAGVKGSALRRALRADGHGGPRSSSPPVVDHRLQTRCQRSSLGFGGSLEAGDTPQVRGVADLLEWAEHLWQLARQA